ncbi:MAG TPA: hypothetical protein VFY90_00760, partial [Tepidiformaceae bacterium]|nr:hypothetical protein [Tepidiformaceae bacterium]
VPESVVWHEDPFDAPPLPGGSPPRLSLIRFSQPAPLLSAPDSAAAVRAVIAPGTRVTVLAEHGDFLEVVTPADEFGFVQRGLPIEEVEAPSLRSRDPV